MNAASTENESDQRCLEVYSRQRYGEVLRPVLARYFALVHGTAARRTDDATQAADVTRAVFSVFARRAHKLRKRTILAGWLFDVTAFTCRKLQRRRWFSRSRSSRQESSAGLPDLSLWLRLAPEIDRAVDRLPTRHRHALLLCSFLGLDSAAASRILRTPERRVTLRTARALKKVAARLERRHIGVGSDTVGASLRAQSCGTTVPEALFGDCARLLNRDGVPLPNLARRTLRSLTWRRWRRRCVIGIPACLLMFAATAAVAWHVDSRSGHSRLIAAFLVWSVKHEAKAVPGLAQPARPWPEDTNAPQLRAASIRTARDLYQTTNIWRAHLHFSRDQWKALQPKRIGALANFFQSDGTALLRNPEAQRSGLAGVLGFDFNWAHANLELSGVAFTNVGARIKGNGTYLGSLYGEKRAFKVDLNQFSKGQKLGAIDELTFNNLVMDHSFVSDALAYEFLRDAGVPAPRTAYAWLSVTVEGKWDRKPLGLYALVEPVDSAFAAERIARKTAIFKPVTYRLFEHLGEEWKSYAAIYDLKTHATVEQQQRVIDFARLVSLADDSEFDGRVGEFLDLEEFARFIAGEVLLSAYDGIFSTGQNFYVYLDPRSNRFGFIPWDLDLAWGNFFLLGTPRQQEQASIWHPWVGENRFLERVFSVDEFRALYRVHLEDFLARLFVPERLNRRANELAAIVRGPIATESDFRLDKFEQALGSKPIAPSRGDRNGADRPAHRIKRFIDKRAISVREQLDGESNGVIMHRNARQ